MARKCLVLILAGVLGCAWAAGAGAGEIGYSLRPQKERGLGQYEPNTAVMALDAALARPLGLATTVLGTGLFVATLPFTIPSGSVEDAAWGLMGQPAGYTFIRPMGYSDPRFENRGVFYPDTMK